MSKRIDMIEGIPVPAAMTSEELDPASDSNANDLFLPAPGDKLLFMLPEELQAGDGITVPAGTQVTRNIDAATVARWTGTTWIFLVQCGAMGSVWAAATPRDGVWSSFSA